MTLAIVTDSNASLPPDLVRDLPLYVVPMQIRHEGRVYQDGVDIAPDAFYALQASSPTPPTTSAPQPGAFIDAFHRAAEHADEIVCLTLSARLSATYNSARAAAHEAVGALGSTRVEVVDTQAAAAAQGLVVLAAARAAAKCADADDILGRVPAWIASVELFGCLATLEYVWRSGRVPRVLMWMGNALGVRPVPPPHQRNDRDGGAASQRAQGPGPRRPARRAQRRRRSGASRRHPRRGPRPSRRARPAAGGSGPARWRCSSPSSPPSSARTQAPASWAAPSNGSVLTTGFIRRERAAAVIVCCPSAPTP